MSVLRPDLMMKCVVPVIMAGIIAIVSTWWGGRLVCCGTLRWTGFKTQGASDVENLETEGTR